MNDHRPDLADVFRTYEKEFFAKWGHVLNPQQRKAFEAIRDCRTAALGGHVEYVEQCDTCGHLVKAYNSCRDRHCPKCQASARAKWLAAREADLLPVPYFHVVFTLPREIGRLALPGKDILRKLEHELGLRLCNLPFADVARSALDEKWAREVFDRIIVAQARLNGLAPLISSDEEVAEHYPRTIW